MGKLKLERINKIAVLGPHDRINFGDLLFPIMLDFALSKTFNSKIELKKYSLIKADFSYLGGFSSNSYKALTKCINNNEIDTVIVAGGESLAAKWSNLYSYINPYYDYFYQKKFLKNNRIFRNIPKLILGNKTEFPFIINTQNYKSTDLKIYYNAVGGGRGLNKSQIDTISIATLIGLRDLSSYNYITNYKQDDKFILIPDSAIILSDVYSKSTLKRKIKGEYVFFQLSNFKHQNKVERVIEQLREIIKGGLKIILCPLGTAKGHEDQIVLNYIHSQLKDENVIFVDTQPSIEEIISLIAHARIYIVTSLHGLITSMSYGVSYMPLNPTQKKLVSFLETWSISELKEVYELESFYENFELIASQDFKQKILTNTDLLKSKYYDFVKKIVETL